MSEEELRDRAQMLGDFIRRRRTASHLPLRQLEIQSGVSRGTLSKLENGQIFRPGADVLNRIAHVLGVSIGELHEAAGYPADSLPSMPVYLRSQYRHLTPDEQRELTQQVEAVTMRYGPPTGHGPQPSEDEFE